MSLPLFQIDAFTDEPFRGNPAAVCLLDAPRADAWMLSVAAAFTKIAVGEVTPGRGAFLIASVDGVDVGCGAVRDIGDRTGELKRMFVRPDHRGRGIASALVASLEDEASALGLVCIVLEVATFSDDAIAMYAKNGYHEIPLFGPYVGSPISTAMGKTLDGAR